VSDTLISDILAAIGTEVDTSVIYPGTSRRSKHSLVTIVGVQIRPPFCTLNILTDCFLKPLVKCIILVNRTPMSVAVSVTLVQLYPLTT
jgi:hypothetical protein